MSGVQVRTGLDQIHRLKEYVSGGRVALATNSAATTARLIWSVEQIVDAGIRVSSLFSPEHGLFAAEADATAVKSATLELRSLRLPVHSLYGERERPEPSVLRETDFIVYDMPDVGARFYTYIWTLSHLLDAAEGCDVEVIVLDRPNPISGRCIEGPGIEDGFAVFEGRRSIPIRHGWTAGEFANWYRTTFAPGARLTVVPMCGWRRSWWWDETSLPWVSPSPAMATLDTATVYTGACLLEGLTLSEGRGTSHPFEWCGHPAIDERRLAATLNELNLAGTWFRPIRFIPAEGAFAGVRCHGVQIHVVDRRVFRPVHVGVCVIAALLPLLGASPWTVRNNRYWIDHLWGSEELRTTLSSVSSPLLAARDWNTASPESLVDQWNEFKLPQYAD